MTFVKGQSGNPAGRPPGSLNKRTLIAEGLLDDDAEKITRKAIDLALAGDRTALRLCIDRILPRGKNRPVPIELAPIETAADVRAAASGIMAGVCAGTLTPTEGSDLMRVVEAVARTLRAVDADARLARVEELLREVMARLDEIDGRPSEAKNTSEKQAPPAHQDQSRPRAAANASKEQAERPPTDHLAGRAAIQSPSAGRPANTREEQADPPASRAAAPANTSAKQTEQPDDDDIFSLPADATPEELAERRRRVTNRILAGVDAVERAQAARDAGRCA